MIYGRQIKSNAEFCMTREKSVFIPMNHEILILIPMNHAQHPPSPPLSQPHFRGIFALISSLIRLFHHYDHKSEL